MQRINFLKTKYEILGPKILYLDWEGISKLVEYSVQEKKYAEGISR